MDKASEDGIDILEIIEDEKYRDRFSLWSPGRERSTCRCPFHNEDTPSFIVFHKTNSFYCFGCKKGGGVVQLLQFLENTDYKTAVELYHSYLSPEKILEVRVKKKLQRTGETNNDINSRFSNFCRQYYQRYPKLYKKLDEKIYEFDQLIQLEAETYTIQRKYDEITSFLTEYARKNK